MTDRVSLTEHARSEARRRGIDEAVALDVARAPEQRFAVGPRREVRQSHFVDPASGKLQLIRVVVDSGLDGETIVTVYRTSKIRKCWRER